MSALRQVCSHFHQRAVAIGSARRVVASGNANIFPTNNPAVFSSSREPLTDTRYDYPSTITRYFSTRSAPANTNTTMTMLVNEDFSRMTNEQLEDTSTIPGWDLIHSPPGKMPRGALVGTVVSTKMQKTVNVAVDRYRIVPKVRKRMKYTRKFFAHDEQEVANLGDLVMIEPCQRISKHKHFMLRKIVRPKGQL